MTKHPHLKDRIRARMARTGEAYMTARRQVVGDVIRERGTARASAGDGPTSRWRHVPGVHPQTSTARILLTNAGLTGPAGGPLSEALVLGLSGGLRLNVYESHYAAEDFSSLYLTPRPLSDDLSFVAEPLERAGATARVEQPGTRGADAALRAALDTGPVAVWFDLAEAGYAGLPSPYSGGAYHVAVALDHDGTRVVLGDVAARPIAVEATRLTAARARIRRYRMRSLRLGAVSGLPEPAALTSLALDASLAGIASQRRAGGPVALDRLAAAMRDEDGERAWSVRFRPGPNLVRALTGMFRFVEAWGTGGGFLRPMFADFLDEAATNLNRPPLRDAAAAYRAAGAGWSGLAVAATPEGIPPLGGFRILETERAAARASGPIDPEDGAAYADGAIALEAEAAAWLAADPRIARDLVAALADRVVELAATERAAEQALGLAIRGLGATMGGPTARDRRSSG